MVQVSHPYMTMEKPLTIWTIVSKHVSAFYMLPRLIIAFLPKSKCLFISWLQSPSAVFLESKKTNFVTAPTFFPSICHEVMGPGAMILLFWMCSFKPAFSLSSFTLIKRLFSSSSLSAIGVASSVYLRLLIFLLAVLIPVCESSSLAFYMMHFAHTASTYSPPNFEPDHCSMSSSNFCFLTCIQISQETGLVFSSP